MYWSSPVPTNGRKSSGRTVNPFSPNIATAAALMSGSESVNTPSMSKITARMFRSPATRQRLAKKNHCHNCFLAVSLPGKTERGDGAVDWCATMNSPFMAPTPHCSAAPLLRAEANIYDAEDLPARQQSVERRRSREIKRRGPADLPVQQARRRPARHQHRRRQHLLQTDRERPAHRRTGRGALGQRLRRRSPHVHEGKLLLALPAETARPPENLRRAQGQRPQVARRRRHGGDVQPLHVQPQSARVVHRYALALVHPGETRGPHASERRYRGRRLGALPGTDKRNLRRRSRLRAVDAARL